MNDTIQTYEEWLARRAYSVVRNRYKADPSTDTVVATGLRLDQAREMAERLFPVHQQLANQEGQPA